MTGKEVMDISNFSVIEKILIYSMNTAVEFLQIIGGIFSFGKEIYDAEFGKFLLSGICFIYIGYVIGNIRGQYIKSNLIEEKIGVDPTLEPYNSDSDDENEDEDYEPEQEIEDDSEKEYIDEQSNEENIENKEETIIIKQFKKNIEKTHEKFIETIDKMITLEFNKLKLRELYPHRGVVTHIRSALRRCSDEEKEMIKKAYETKMLEMDENLCNTILTSIIDNLVIDKEIIE